MPSASTSRQRATTRTAAHARKATWARPAEYDTAPTPDRGRGAVQHDAEQRGRRSARFPDLHISATAAKLGITKSHLGKVLSGTSRPSAELALRLAEVLGKDANYVLSLYNAPKGRRSRKR